MKSLLALAAAFLISSPAFAAVKIATTDCNSYGPQASNLAVSTDWEFVDVGYITMGVFFGIKTVGCEKFELKDGDLLCDGVRIATHEKLQSTEDNGGEPRGYLKFDSSVEVVASGSCARKGAAPLQLSIKK